MRFGHQVGFRYARHRGDDRLPHDWGAIVEEIALQDVHQRDCHPDGSTQHRIISRDRHLISVLGFIVKGRLCLELPGGADDGKRGGIGATEGIRDAPGVSIGRRDRIPDVYAGSGILNDGAPVVGTRKVRGGTEERQRQVVSDFDEFVASVKPMSIGIHRCRYPRQGADIHAGATGDEGRRTGHKRALRGVYRQRPTFNAPFGDGDRSLGIPVNRPVGRRDR